MKKTKFFKKNYKLYNRFFKFLIEFAYKSGSHEPDSFK